MSELQDLGDYVDMPTPSLETFEERYMKVTDAKALEKMQRQKARREAQLKLMQQQQQDGNGDNRGEPKSDHVDDEDMEYIVYGDDDPDGAPPTVLYAKVGCAFCVCMYVCMHVNIYTCMYV